MGLFRHPCLTRGIVHTPYGAFSVVRGLVEVPDSVGESLGWLPYDDDVPTVGPGLPELSDERSVRNPLDAN